MECTLAHRIPSSIHDCTMAASVSGVSPKVNTEHQKITMHETEDLEHRGHSRAQEDGQLKAEFSTVQRSFGFWAIIIGLGIMLLLAALEK